MLLILLLGAAVAWAALPSAPRYLKDGALHTVREGSLLYTFDAVWRREAVFVVDPDTGVATAVAPGEVDAGRVDRLRHRLFDVLGVGSLDGVPGEGLEELEAIRSLGYI